MLRRRKKKRKLKTWIRYLIFALIPLAAFVWQQPARGKALPEEMISHIQQGIDSGSRYALFRAASEFLTTWPGHDKIYWAHMAMGVYHRDRGDHEDAAADFARALSGNGIPVELAARMHSYLSLEYLRLGRDGQALAETVLACRMTKNIEELGYLYYQKGHLENRLKKFREAIDSLNSGKRLSPDPNLLAAVMLEEAYAQQNLHSLQLAEMLYREILDKFPDAQGIAGVAQESLERIRMVREMENRSSREVSDLKKILEDERRFFY
ncbi:MAG: hypothetical protein PHQ23_09225 [Candidatus Wallbacteria bacterium]|nr:hypothetical protein [Candidatus Wallbacteria bacterium]